MATQWTRSRVSELVDHTLLKPEATENDIAFFVEEATELDVYAICVSPSMLKAVSRCGAVGLTTAAVVGFPSGKHVAEIKAHEASVAVAMGATEIDMVIDVGAAVAGDFETVRAEIAYVRSAIPNTVLKVIVESAALLDIAGEQTLIDVCRAAMAADADFVKTSTGFHPAGGASVRAVELMADTVGPEVEVKASGGIRTAADAIAMLDAGATRLGLSGTRAVLDGLPD
ncbi:deoxyribose-phosphate aldolase [Mycolicibacterium lacusdiani]|uniref:deoxyribose-phosphate aldolase n=1 Tax=Mycolicibacterium lacusdiani TaxID=2895283 RepID=UPI001F00BDA8|nr:deoxyribose-phosphate aldolase [Mycolicibacterium lacusdiani]